MKKILMTNGYVGVYCPNHPSAYSNGCVYEHRKVMEDSLGRVLNPNEHIHHINGNKQDNRIENLLIVTNRDHQHIHKPPKQPHPCVICGGLTTSPKYCSTDCSDVGRRRVERPSEVKLQEDLTTGTYVSLGKQYGVSDKTVRKWAIKYGLTEP